MNVAVIYNEPDATQPDSADVLSEVECVRKALERLRYAYRIFPVREGSQAVLGLLNDLLNYDPDVVFNLVEGLGTDPRRQALVSGLLEISGLPYTGSSAYALLTTTDKTLTKAVLGASGLPTPAWQTFHGRPAPVAVPAPWIIKPAWEDASVGIDDDSVIRDASRLEVSLSERARRHPGQPLILENFIEGREFNVSLLDQGGGVEALPAAEIVFDAWPKDKPKIVNYQAKWDPTAFEYQHTQRSFNLEQSLQDQLRKLALDCWPVFHLNGYARVDLRQSPAGELLVIEINANPCIAPDAGFMAAVEQSGSESFEAIRKILASAHRSLSR